MLIENLLVAITFHYDETRLGYLKEVCEQIPNLGFKYEFLIITNIQEQSLIAKIRDQLWPLKNYGVISYPTMGHPYFLTWGHLPIFRSRLSDKAGYTHFMYLEDDIKVTPQNIAYWLRGRYELRNYGFYPSFVRYEDNYLDKNSYSTDITEQLRFTKLPHLFITTNYAYLNSPQQYQGMYLMDREMMIEYFNSAASSPDFGSWNIREKATQGLTFLNVPKYFFSRNLIGCNLSLKMIDVGSLIKHLPGNYANNPQSTFGKIPIKNLIRF